jgi:hypothetical protein
LSFLSAKNPIQRPSGEKKGPEASSVPGRSVAAVSASGRTKR